MTNSSSSSFVVAAAENLSETAKDSIVQWAIRQFLGRPVLRPGATDEDIDAACEAGYWAWRDDCVRKEVREALSRGLTVYEGCVNFEDPYDIAQDYQGMWNALEGCPSEFEVIQGDLSY